MLEAETDKPLSPSDLRAQHFAREAIGYYELATEVLAGHHHGPWARPPAPASEP